MLLTLTSALMTYQGEVLGYYYYLHRLNKLLEIFLRYFGRN